MIGRSVVILALSLLLLSFALLAAFILSPPAARFDRADAIIVLGSPLTNGRPGPALDARVRRGVALFDAGKGRVLIFTGGRTRRSAISEADAAAGLARTLGVPAAVIAIDRQSQSTVGNLRRAQALLAQKGLASALIVSDPVHLRRALMIADGLGLRASPIATAPRQQTISGRAISIAREVLAFPRDWLAMRLSAKAST